MTTRTVLTAVVSPAAGRRGQRGFSMIEALIAAALIGLVAIGLIPMFTRAMSDNMAGSDYTRVSNYAKSEEEDFARAPYGVMSTEIAVGSTTAQKLEYLNPATLQWVIGTPPAGNSSIVWTRTTTYSQYSIYDTDTDQTFDYPVPGGTSPDAVQILQAQVQVKAVSPIGPEGGHRSTIIRFLKAF
jgi:prepilin-type N-terminal cleavage/methylation domain-containing protein